MKTASVLPKVEASLDLPVAFISPLKNCFLWNSSFSVNMHPTRVFLDRSKPMILEAVSLVGLSMTTTSVRGIDGQLGSLME
jgi:hypothetical protein